MTRTSITGILSPLTAKKVFFSLNQMKYDLLASRKTYVSADIPVSWLARRYATPVFYAKVIMIVATASRLAKRGIYKDNQWIRSSYHTVKALESVGGNFKIENANVFRELKTACVFVSNHMSVLETFVLPCLIQPSRDVTFVVKKSLIDYPFFKWVMRSRHPIVVGRENPREDLRAVLEQGQRRLKNNISVIIFPQTTRSEIFDPKAFNTLGVKLALRGNVPVVPVALKTDAWGIGRKYKDFGKIEPAKRVHFCFGEPIHVKGSGKNEHKVIVDYITGKINAWQAEQTARSGKAGNP
ncbi:MAG: lysophospholipid acyltransferase family protein [Gammaproteobacteria bacterium]